MVPMRIGACVVTIVLAAASVACVPPEDQPVVPKPPFRKQWERSSEDYVNNYVVSDGVLYYGSDGSYGAIGLSDGSPRWVKPAKGATVELGDGVLYVAVGRHRLIACDPQSGRELWAMPAKHLEWLVSHRGTLYVERRDGTLTAVDTARRRTRWTVDLETRPREVEGRTRSLCAPPAVEDHALFTASCAGEVLRLDSRTGRVAWRHRTDENRPAVGVVPGGTRIFVVVDGHSAVNPGDVWQEEARGDLLVALDLQTGRELWRHTTRTGIESSRLAGDTILLTATDGRLHAVDAATGSPRWRQTVSTKLYPHVADPVVQGETVLTGNESHVIAYTVDGERLWELDTEDELSDLPVTALEDGLLVADRFAFRRYVTDLPDELPTGRAARRDLAAGLAARLMTLSRDEARALRKLGGEAARELLVLVNDKLERIAVEVPAQVSCESYCRNSAIVADREQLNLGLRHLRRVASPVHTGALLELLPLARCCERGELLDLLADRGDQRATPMFLAGLREAPGSWAHDAARRYVARSSDPEVIQLLVSELRGGDDRLGLQELAFTHLGETGGPAGIAAVLAAQDQSRTLPRLDEQMELDRLGLEVKPLDPFRRTAPSARLLATRRGEAGVLWGLIESEVVGWLGLWIAHHDGTRWVAPLFTGVTGDNHFAPPGSATEDRPRAPKDWFERFVGAEAIARDTDGDGWTDLVERQLGTDPRNPDTDGDGLPDSRDKNPLAAPRPLADDEQVLVRALEAVVRSSRGPTVVELPEGTRPLELHGPSWIILPATPGSTNTVSFSLPKYDFARHALHGEGTGTVLYNAARTEAKVHVSEEGCDVHLRKHAGRWLVIGVKRFRSD